MSDNVRQVACLGAAGFLGTMIVLAVAVPSPAHAKTPIEVVKHVDSMTERVPYGDLSLATKEGQHLLYRRVGFAVDRVCPKLDEEGQPYDVMDCRAFAWGGAKPQIKDAIRRAQSGASLAMAIEIVVAK